MAIAIVNTSPLGGMVAVGVRTGADVAVAGADVAGAVAGAGVTVLPPQEERRTLAAINVTIRIFHLGYIALSPYFEMSALYSTESMQ
jgi:hypothetical protein